MRMTDVKIDRAARVEKEETMTGAEVRMNGGGGLCREEVCHMSRLSLATPQPPPPPQTTDRQTQTTNHL